MIQSLKGFTKGKGKGKKFIPTSRKKIAIGDNPEGDSEHNKFIDPKSGEGHRGLIVALNKKRTEAILEAKTTSISGGIVKEGKLFHVKEEDPDHYPSVVKQVKTIPKGFEPATTRAKQTMDEQDSGEIPPETVYDKSILLKKDGRFFLVDHNASYGTLAVDEYEKDGKDFKLVRNIYFSQGEDTSDILNSAGAYDNTSGFELVSDERVLDYLEGAGSLQLNNFPRRKQSLELGTCPNCGQQTYNKISKHCLVNSCNGHKGIT